MTSQPPCVLSLVQDYVTWLGTGSHHSLAEIERPESTSSVQKMESQQQKALTVDSRALSLPPGLVYFYFYVLVFFFLGFFCFLSGTIFKM